MIQNGEISPINAAIVTFKTLQATNICLQTVHSSNTDLIQILPAPDPLDLIYQNLSIHSSQRFNRTLLVQSFSFSVLMF